MNYLSDLVVEHSRKRPDVEAVVFERNRLSFKQFNERVNRLANGLLSMGLRKGDHIGVLLENCHQYLEVYYAA
ncbi:MAG: AMP-binding protein, partial [bacterium]|nr:AMP-binding protein [bacterium]